MELVTVLEYGSDTLLILTSLPPLALFPIPAWLWKGVQEGKQGAGSETLTGVFLMKTVSEKRGQKQFDLAFQPPHAGILIFMKL